MGKPEETLGDTLTGFDVDLSPSVLLNHLANPLLDPLAILARATTRLVYDLFAYFRTRTDPQPQPVVICVLARETHDADLQPGQKPKAQHSFSYFDGFGREIQKKIQAEPAAVGGPPRWVGSGWTIFNNKGKTGPQIRAHTSAPRITSSSAYSPGVSGILCLPTPEERIVATLHPDHTWEKVVFNPWRQETWDVTDTVATDPTLDPDVADFFRRLPGTEYLPGWYAQRIAGTRGDRDRGAAIKAQVHAATPSVAHSDSLGPHVPNHRPQQTPGAVTRPCRSRRFHQTRVTLDIEGNPRVVIDAKKPHRHALRLRHARQPHPPVQHGSRGTLDAQRRDRQGALCLG